MDMNICRICLQKRDTVYSLYRKRKGITPYETLLKYTKLKLNKDDESPSHICAQCIIEMDRAIAFLDKCEKSNCKLTEHREKTLVFNQRLNDLKYSSENGFSNQYSRNIDDKDEISELPDEMSVLKPVKCSECGSKRRCNHWTPPTTFTCKFCEKVFNRKFNYNLHIKRHTGGCKWPCPECGAQRSSRGAARAHCSGGVRRACPLPDCGKTFTTNTNLQTHIRKHTGERPYQCSKCDKRFICRNTLNDHLRIHTGVKPYMCAICGARFTTNKLAAHARTHAAPRDRPHPCPAPACTRRFLSVRALRLHSAVHAGAGERGAAGVQCGQCGARYAHSQSLKKHIRKQHAHAQKIHPTKNETG